MDRWEVAKLEKKYLDIFDKWDNDEELSQEEMEGLGIICSVHTIDNRIERWKIKKFFQPLEWLVALEENNNEL